MRIEEIVAQVELVNGKIKSKQTGNIYEVNEFVDKIAKTYNLSAKEKKELAKNFISYLKPQSEKSIYVESIINKYDFKFSDGVYIIRNSIMTLDEIYRLLWKEERLLPTEVDEIIENVEKISEPMELQNEIFEKIKAKAKVGKSKYLESLYILYPNIKWKEILYNIITPKSKPLFHIFYDDGVGGTGKSTLLEVLTKIAGENFTSNVLLDQFGNRFIFANMLGKYLNIGDDNGKNDELQNVGTLKSIITGNRVTIDRKNISPIEVRIFAKQLFATNILPYIDFTDGGIMRRLNIVSMNKVIPKDMKLCSLDEEEISHIIYEVLQSKDLEKGENELAITTSPLYRFISSNENINYYNYCSYCDNNGFRKMNIINYEVKSKFINAYIDSKKSIELIEEENQPEELPF